MVRIKTSDPDDIMPPPKSHKTLTAEEKGLLAQWIKSGAKYEKFWAFEAPSAPKAPSVGKGDWSDQVIDLHVLHRLEEEGMAPAAEADRRTGGP